MQWIWRNRFLKASPVSLNILSFSSYLYHKCKDSCRQMSHWPLWSCILCEAQRKVINYKCFFFKNLSYLNTVQTIHLVLRAETFIFNVHAARWRHEGIFTALITKKHNTENRLDSEKTIEENWSLATRIISTIFAFFEIFGRTAFPVAPSNGIFQCNIFSATRPF